MIWIINIEREREDQLKTNHTNVLCCYQISFYWNFNLSCIWSTTTFRWSRSFVQFLLWVIKDNIIEKKITGIRIKKKNGRTKNGGRYIRLQSDLNQTKRWDICHAFIQNAIYTIYSQAINLLQNFFRRTELWKRYCCQSLAIDFLLKEGNTRRQHSL